MLGSFEWAVVVVFLSFLLFTEPHCSAWPGKSKWLKGKGKVLLPSLIRVAASSTSPPASSKMDWRSVDSQDWRRGVNWTAHTVQRVVGKEFLQLLNLRAIFRLVWLCLSLESKRRGLVRHWKNGKSKAGSAKQTWVSKVELTRSRGVNSTPTTTKAATAKAGIPTPTPTTTTATMKRARPANLTLLPDTSRAFYPAIALDADDAPDSPPSPLTPSSSSSPSLILSPAPDFTLGVDADDLSRDLADLARLRKNVQRNLRLRPIRSFNALPNVSAHRDHACRSARQSSPSSSSATSSVYYTPVDPIPSSPLHSPPPSVLAASAWHPGLLADRLSSSKRPILIDTRPYATYQVSHLAGSVNIAIPSLILKRYRKPGGGFHSLDSLRQYVTSEEDKQQWDIQSAPGGDRWDGDIVIIHGEETDESDKDNLQVTAWALLPVLSVLLGPGRVHYLRGGMPAAQLHPRLSPHIVVQNILNTNVSEQPLKSAKGTGVFQINTAAPTTTTFPDVTAPEPSLFAYQLSDSPDEPTLSPSQPIHRPRSVPSRHPSAQNLWRAGDQPLTLPRLQIRTEPTCPATMPVTPTQSTTSMSPHISLPPQSPSHLTLLHSNHTPPAASPRWTSSPGEFLPPPPSVFTQSPYSLTPPRTPDTPMPNIPVRSPGTSRPFNMAPSSSGSDLSEELPTFSVSTILPGFLYLGPELSLPTHVTELKALGIRRILNIAAECDADDYGLALDHEFERYIRVPMRDTVEEEKVRDCLRLVCQILGAFSPCFPRSTSETNAYSLNR